MKGRGKTKINTSQYWYGISLIALNPGFPFQSCETKSGMESLGSRLHVFVSCPAHVCLLVRNGLVNKVEFVSLFTKSGKDQ